MLLTLLLLLSLTSCSLRAQSPPPDPSSPPPPPPILGPYVSAGNFAADLTGTPDTRPGTWGNAGYVVWEQKFNPPEGYAVQILEITGDLVAWPSNSGLTPAVVDPGRCYGALAGLHSTDEQGVVRGGSSLGTLMADDTLFYVQGAGCGSTAVNRDYHVYLYNVENAVLNSSNTLIWKVAAWLNDTGFPIHFELTYSQLKFQFVLVQPTAVD